MKTIQQVLNELDAEEIENAFFYEHPINLLDVNELEDISIGEFRKNVSSKFQAFLERLKTMEVVSDLDEPALLFVCKSEANDRLLGHAVELIHLNEIMEEEDLSQIQTYAYEFTEQKEALGFFVADTKLTQDNIMDVVVDFLFEISFFGYEQEYLAEEIEKLDEAMKEIEEHPERLERVDLDEFSKECGIPIEEVYPKEDEKKRAYHMAGMEYTEYCKIIELDRIKQSLVEELMGNKGNA